MFRVAHRHATDLDGQSLSHQGDRQIKETTNDHPPNFRCYLEYLDPTDDSIRRFCPVLTYWPFCPIPLWNDDNYVLLRPTPVRRQAFFDAIRA